MAIDRRATRLGVLGLVGLILFSLIGVRLWFLQTVKADELQELSTIARTRTVQIPPERGRIFDVDGRILADNQRVLTVAVDWQQLRRRTDRLEIFRRLSAWVDVPIEDMEGRFQAADRQPVPADADQAGDRRAHSGGAARTHRGLPRPPHPHRVEARVPVRAARRPRRRLHGRDHRGPVERRLQDGGLPAQRTGRPVRRREEHGVGAARHVGASRSSRSTPPTARCA